MSKITPFVGFILSCTFLIVGLGLYLMTNWDWWITLGALPGTGMFLYGVILYYTEQYTFVKSLMEDLYGD